MRAVEPVPVRGDRTVPLAGRHPAFPLDLLDLLDQQARRSGKDHGSAASWRDRADEANNEQRSRATEVQFTRVVPVPEPLWHIPRAWLGEGNQRASPVSRRRPGGRAEQVVEDSAYPLGQDPGLNGVALGGFQVARELAPGGSVVAPYAMHVFQFAPPLPFHGGAVGARERLPDHDKAVALEALDVGRSQGGEL